MTPNVLDLDFDKQEPNVDTIKRLFPTIEHYRNQKKTLLAIYNALSKKGELAMAYQSFRNCYYAHRRKIKSQENTAVGSPPASDSIVTASSDLVKRTKHTAGDRLSKESNLSIHLPSESTASAKEAASAHREIRVEDVDLAEELARHQAQAAHYFNKT